MSYELWGRNVAESTIQKKSFRFALEIIELYRELLERKE